MTMTTLTVPAMSDEDLDQLGAEFDAIRASIQADLGERDVAYIRRLIRIQRRLEVAGRAMLWAGFIPPLWVGGVVALSISKILDNMEIGHNIMHGQYDWTGDPALKSHDFEWDSACPSDQWRHGHNYVHHTYTNIIGKDRDVGYGVLRMSEETEWRPAHRANPLSALLLALTFEYGVAFHDLETERIRQGTWDLNEMRPKLRGVGKKIGKQVFKDYVLFPLLSGPGFVATAAGNAIANLVRNLWAFTIIFCGHFPDGVAQFSEEEAEEESRGGWYLRQILGSANIRGGRLFHVMSGNLSFQIEHHLYPDLPAHRYKEVAPQVEAICAQFGIPYNTGRLSKQFGTVVRRIFSLARKPRARADRTGGAGAWQAPRLRVSASALPADAAAPRVLPAAEARRVRAFLPTASHAPLQGP